MYKNYDHPKNMINFSRYKSLVVDSKGTNERIKFCKIIKINPQYISEIVEIGHVYLRCPEKLYDELLTFLNGKKIVLVEKVNVPQNKIFRRFEIKCDDEDARFGYFHIDLKINLNKLIMSNGNKYYVIAE